MNTIDLKVTDYIKRAVEVVRNNGLEYFDLDLSLVATMIQKEELSNKVVCAEVKNI